MKKSHLIAKYNNFAERVLEDTRKEMYESFNDYLPADFNQMSEGRKDKLIEQVMHQAYSDIRKILLQKLKKAQKI